MKRDRSAVSTMVGVAIAIAIFFTTLIPLYVYTSTLYNLYSNELNSRRIRDIDRATESLEIAVEGKITPIPGTDNQIRLILKNLSPLMIRTQRIWAMDVERATPIGDDPCIRTPIDIPPGGNNSIHIHQCLTGFTGRAQFIAVTERGRLFASAPVLIIGGRLASGLYPYTLTVSIINMKRGNQYTILVSPERDADTQPRSVTYKATASNENVSLSFGATAGTFRIYLLENGVLVHPTRLIAPRTNPAEVTLPDYWNVVFILTRTEVTPLTIDLEIIAPARVLEGESFSIDITLSLPAQAGENVRINHDAIRNAIGLAGDFEAGSLYCLPLGDVLTPGMTTIALRCQLSAADLRGNSPGLITVTVPSLSAAATGIDSGLPYPSDSDSTSITVRPQRRG
jgi:hypothetical protein